MMSDATVVARRIAAYNLSDTDPISIPGELWPEVLGHITFEHLTGLAVAMFEAGQLLISGRQTQELLAQQRDAMALALINERKLLEIAEAFEREGIDFIVLKGPAVAHTFYPDPSWRPFVDIDLLVRTRDWKHACAVLAARGMRRRLPEPRRNFDVRFGKAAAHKGDDGLEVDLHRTLVLGPFGLWMNPDEFFEHRKEFEVGGHVFARLDDTAALLNACVHASLGAWPPQLLPTRDIAQLALVGIADWGALANWGERWRVDIVLKHAFETASNVLGWEMRSEARAMATIRATNRSLRALEAYTTERRARGGTARSTLTAIPRIHHRVAYLRAMLFPRRSFREARLRGTGQPSFTRRLKVPLSWLSARR
jgi:putative nucleotidyltransferase-like protein